MNKTEKELQENYQKNLDSLASIETGFISEMAQAFVKESMIISQDESKTAQQKGESLVNLINGTVAVVYMSGKKAGIKEATFKVKEEMLRH